nr:hypothetical protein [Maricaulis sp.]
MINGPPEIEEFAVYSDENFIEMSGPVRVVCVLDAASSDRRREEWTEAVPPKSHCFMSDIDAAFVEQILDVPERQRKTDIQHHGQADDLGRRLENI